MEYILKILKENQGKYISGETLAQTSGITRAGIWKQIEQLREIGYLIDSAPHKGYRLMNLTPVLHPLEIKDGLDTACFGQVSCYQPEVDSTNRWAKELANQGSPEGTLVIAENQTQGRGRMGRSWASAPGLGLWFSLILRPRVKLSDLAGITLLTAVMMARAIHQVTGIQVRLKWPNDLMYDGRKLGGILAEIAGEMDMVNYLILGIGLNVNHTPGDFPAELKEKAISIHMITSQDFSRKKILQEFLKIFEMAYYDLPKSGMAQWLEYAKTYSATLGKEVKINQGTDRILLGTAIELATDGSLLIREPGGNVVKVYSGDIIELNKMKNP